VPQATLRTARLTLEPLGDGHLEHEVELDSDPEVMRHLTGRARTRAEVVALHRTRLAVARRAPGLGFWVGTTGSAGTAGAAGWEPVGWWLLEPPTRPDHQPVAGQAELGYRLLRRHWRQGLAGEGARALLRHAFTDLGLDRVFAETMAVNTASRATMASLGMTHVRTFRPDLDGDPLPGAEAGEVEYAITRAEWASATR
jgi:RimJ/RimL family protein N-acetyltransferase